MIFGLDALDTLFVVWEFFYLVVLIVHFAVRKRFYESYTVKFSWIVYALSIPAFVISLILLFGGRSWSFWLGGFLCLLFSAFGYYIDYVKKIPWRKPLNPRIMFPYVTLYLATLMFYWWPLGLLNKPLWYVYAGLFLIATLLNITSH
jgi:hypothetical protein